MFAPHTQSEIEEMLKSIGVKSVSDLFVDIPDRYRYPSLNLPDAMTEMEIMAEMDYLAQSNDSTKNLVCFLGAGAYNHFIPAAVNAIIQRGEFFTAYTPYQPEISQGTLQAIFEYQSLISSLTGMDISNASHYDGATASAEAVIMAYHNFRGKRSKVILSPSIHPQYRQVIRTYTQGYNNFYLVGDHDGTADPFNNPFDLVPLIDQNTALVLLQYPDFLGRIFDFSSIVTKAHESGALVAIICNPIALGILHPPGDYGADIAVGEGQPLGLSLSFGGPYLGFFATKRELVRKISGRLVGETIDNDGKRAYVLTLTAREQHIRREKATSNICTNQGLMALASTVYMCLLGKQGLKQVANLCFQKAHFAAQKINSLPGFSVCSSAPFFNEFVVCCPQPVDEINAQLLEKGIIGGYNLEKDFPGLKNNMLIAVTEMNSREEIDLLCHALEEITHG